MLHINYAGYKRLQARTARRLYAAGERIVVVEAGMLPAAEDINESSYCARIDGPGALDFAAGFAEDCGGELWYWVPECVSTERGRNHGAREKQLLASYINEYFTRTLHQRAPVQMERLSTTPRALLRRLWAECMVHGMRQIKQAVGA